MWPHIGKRPLPSTAVRRHHRRGSQRGNGLEANYADFRRRAQPKPASPAANTASVPGSGIRWPTDGLTIISAAKSEPRPRLVNVSVCASNKIVIVDIGLVKLTLSLCVESIRERPNPKDDSVIVSGGPRKSNKMLSASVRSRIGSKPVYVITLPSKSMLPALGPKNR